MSEYEKGYCPKHGATALEDGNCMTCMKNGMMLGIKISSALEDDDIMLDKMILGRRTNGEWHRAILYTIDHEAEHPFITGAPDGSEYGLDMIAPLDGNSKIINTKEDPFCLWDKEKLYEVIR